MNLRGCSLNQLKYVLFLPPLAFSIKVCIFSDVF